MINYKRIYEFRFQSVDTQKKQIVWKELSQFIYNKCLNKPAKILDPAGGMCEFINEVPSTEKWVMDIEEDFVKKHASQDVNVLVCNNLKPDPLAINPSFNAVFASNFLEHLSSQEEVALFLENMHKLLLKNGRICLMGPNFKYCYKTYFDFADHKIILTETSIAEHLYAAGFNIISVTPRFFPLSFRSGKSLPIKPWIIRLYLSMPFIWRFFGKQFLIVGEKS